MLCTALPLIQKYIVFVIEEWVCLKISSNIIYMPWSDGKILMSYGDTFDCDYPCKHAPNASFPHLKQLCYGPEVILKAYIYLLR